MVHELACDDVGQHRGSRDTFAYRCQGKCGDKNAPFLGMLACNVRFTDYFMAYRTHDIDFSRYPFQPGGLLDADLHVSRLQTPVFVGRPFRIDILHLHRQFRGVKRLS
ncbi:hypothetical protein SDC9_105749 [bioreactor metagenome]|uniref:Uncharacterized protein n=1 Tax=bioreactor metagenome TaxID=1076179 RepID=A0A645B1H6_9ZZZZ